PDEALRALKDGAPLTPGALSAPAPRSSGPATSGTTALATSQPHPHPRQQAPQADPTMRLRRFEDVVALAGEKREIVLKAALERDVRLLRFEEGRLEIALNDGASRTLANDLT